MDIRRPILFATVFLSISGCTSGGFRHVSSGGIKSLDVHDSEVRNWLAAK